jgi:endonuclease/exonuclease/phosphatase family metal-dependent hydrolase
MFTPDCAKEIETRLEECGDGLLRGGSSWSNIYTGGAAQEESHFCSASLGFRDVFRSRPLVRLLSFPLFHLPSVLKTAMLLLVEFFIAFRDLFHGVARGESLLQELKMVFARVFICIGLRELLAIGAKIDAARGLPVIHVNFLGYDEQAHRRGPSSAFAHWSLAGIDRAIKGIYRAAQRSARRDYQLWVFSDHGQEATQFFDTINDEGLESVISDALDRAERKTASARRDGVRSRRVRLTGGRSSQRRTGEWFRQEALTLFEEKSFTIMALGPVGHLYLKERPSFQQKRDIGHYLVREGKVPGVLLCDESGKVEWLHARGKTLLPEEIADFLPHPEPVRKELMRDMAELGRSELAGDLILLGWGPDTPTLSFANERGSHAGPGPNETQGFTLLPVRTRLPDPKAEFLRPSDLRAAALHFLGRQLLPSAPSKVRSTVRQLRVMTYNVHGCLGMDGRISPQRIASVIDRYNPDLVALQELDFGRVRSQRHDQPRLIAEELGMHVSFCPTVVDQDEQYGHALLSHFPMKVIRTEILRSGAQTLHIEPRGALWVKLEVDGFQVHLMNTHFGLRRHERLAQVADLLDRNWIGAIGEEEPLIVCGDFNMFPGSEPYRALSRRLRDVQRIIEKFSPLNTFTTVQPFARIDHIFVSQHFIPTSVVVPRNHLTRVASDHLPLISDLVFRNGLPSS